MYTIFLFILVSLFLTPYLFNFYSRNLSVHRPLPPTKGFRYLCREKFILSNKQAHSTNLFAPFQHLFSNISVDFRHLLCVGTSLALFLLIWKHIYLKLNNLIQSNSNYLKLAKVNIYTNYGFFSLNQTYLLTGYVFAIHGHGYTYTPWFKTSKIQAQTRVLYRGKVVIGFRLDPHRDVIRSLSNPS